MIITTSDEWTALYNSIKQDSTRSDEKHVFIYACASDADSVCALRILEVGPVQWGGAAAAGVRAGCLPLWVVGVLSAASCECHAASCECQAAAGCGSVLVRCTRTAGWGRAAAACTRNLRPLVPACIVLPSAEAVQERPHTARLDGGEPVRGD